MSNPIEDWDFMEEIFEAVPGARSLVACPDDGCSLRRTRTFKGHFREIRYVDDVLWMVVHLNDTHRWSRERIADWLDSLDTDLTFKVQS